MNNMTHIQLAQELQKARELLVDERSNKAKLAKKMAEVIKLTKSVEKKGENSEQHYKFAKHSDIIAELRQHIATQGIFILPHPESYTTQEVLSQYGKKGAIITMNMRFEIIDTETGYSFEVNWQGQGQDYGDKAMYKSYTGALKYFLLDTFQISTGDDPENSDPEAEKAPKQAPQRPQAPANRPQAPQAPKAPIQQPAINDVQKSQIKALMISKGKTQEDIDEYCNKVFKKPLEQITGAQANVVIKNLTAAPDLQPEQQAPVDTQASEQLADEVDAGLNAQESEAPVNG